MEDKKYAQLNRALMSGMKSLSMQQGDITKAFQGLHHAALKAGAVDTATKELMAVACSIVTHCESCIASHTASAIRAGASKEAFFETLGVAVLMGGGPALTYAAKAIEAYEEFTA